MTAIRTQRTRKTKPGIPIGSVYVGRPSRWGNQYKVGEWHPTGIIHSSLCAVELYYQYLKNLAIYKPNQIVILLVPILDRNLCCWCKPDNYCHADILIALAAHLKDILLSADYGTLIPQSVESWPKISDIYSAH